MHKDLVRIQEKMVENVGENLRTLEISDKRPMIVSVLALAERPLAEEEIAARTRVGPNEVRKGLGFLVKKELVVKSADGPSGKVGYELNPDVEKIALRNIQVEDRGREKHHKESCGRM